jgi:rhamnose utilization protein RhaD (predicted bifunctional aldolase and dehydrogenase)
MGDPQNDLCIEAEGNVSGCESPEDIWVKGSGIPMRGITEEGFARVSTTQILEAVRSLAHLGEGEARDLLNAAKTDDGPASPSTETFMHAVLLARSEFRFVAHGHPTPLLSLLVLQEAEQWASKRLFPDEIVLCGPAACWVPYVPPGLPLAREIDRSASVFLHKYGIEPKSYWLQNHGLIVLGRTHREAMSAAAMSVKAARVLLGALQSGRGLRWLTDAEVDQIYRWPDEHARQQRLWR